MTKPTHADMDLAKKLTTRYYNEEDRYDCNMDEDRAAQILAKHVAKAVEAERQRMCDVAYEVYNESDMPEEWMDGAYAVIEAIGKEVK